MEQRLAEVAEELERNEAALTEIQDQLRALEGAVVEAEWVASVLRDLDAVWDVLTPDNRQRLVRAVVEQVVVDEPAGAVEIRLANLEEPEA